MTIELRARTILVTGGSSGVGLELVRALHARGNRLLVVARSREKLERLRAQYPGIIIYPCGIAHRSAVEALCDSVLKEYPDLSVVFNNAAVQFTAEFLSDQFEFDHIEYEVRTNFLAPLWITALLLPAMKTYQGDAAIINIGSGLGMYPKKSSAVYCATKAAIHSISQSINYQLAGTNVRVVEAILPLVDTPMTAGRGSAKISPSKVVDAIVAGVEQGKREIFIGKARLLPILSRLSPGFAKSVMRRM
jgi:short-subunit dehydrogenase involved in D-alanine esterification of teichoic acids